MKTIYLIFFNLILISCQSSRIDNKDILSQYNSANIEARDNFVLPIDEKYINKNRANSIWYGFGFKKNPITGEILFINYTAISCPTGTIVKSMSDGIITFKGFDKHFIKVIVSYNDFIIEYMRIKPDESIYVGSNINKGQKIGIVVGTGFCLGPRLYLRIKYKDIYLDPYLLF